MQRNQFLIQAIAGGSTCPLLKHISRHSIELFQLEQERAAAQNRSDDSH